MLEYLSVQFYHPVLAPRQATRWGLLHANLTHNGEDSTLRRRAENPKFSSLMPLPCFGVTNSLKLI